MKAWKPGKVILACDELRAYIKGKRIALMMNTTATGNDGRLLIDTIAEEKWADIECFFGMEHGVRGNLYGGDGNLADIDEKTGIRIVNLYKFPRFRPPVEEVAKVDAVVFCAQDVGVRHWTYTPWMIELIEACAAVGCEVIVLDRPNPIRGDIVEGCPAEEKYRDQGLITGFGYPLRHGMTIGELALMYRDVRGIDVKITVLKMRGWRRDMWYDETGLVWLPGSPNMPTVDTPLYFAATGLMQSSTISLGIGTTTPFQYVGSPDFNGGGVADALNALDIPGVYFVPKYYMAMTYLNPKEGADRKLALCDGVIMVIHDRNIWRPVTTQLHIMDTLNRLYPGMINFEHGGRVRMGTDEICDALKENRSLTPVIEKWEMCAKEFERMRQGYLLY